MNQRTPMTAEEYAEYENKILELRKIQTMYVETHPSYSKQLKKLKIDFGKAYDNQSHEYYLECFMTPKQYTLFALQNIPHQYYDMSGRSYENGHPYYLLRRML